MEAAILSTIFIASVSSKRYSLGVDSPSPHRRQKVSIAPAPPPKIPLSILVGAYCSVEVVILGCFASVFEFSVGA